MSEVFNADVLDAINRALSAENVVTREGEEPVYCNVNNETREIEIPGEITIFGVEHDENAVRVFFKCPKIIGDNVDIDITKSMVYIIYINAGGEKDQYIVTDVNETEDGDVTFSWLINRKPAKYQGITQFGIRVIKSKTGGEIENEWNTTVANANILNGVETEDIELSGDNIDVVNQLLDLTKQEIELTKQNSIEEIEQKGEETLATIPSDYTTVAQNALSAKNEVEDIHIGYDGTEYESAGEAVRSQIGSLSGDLGISTSGFLPVHNKMEIGHINTSGVNVKDVNAVRTVDYIDVPSGGNYKLVILNGYNFNIRYYNSEYIYCDRTTYTETIDNFKFLDYPYYRYSITKSNTMLPNLYDSALICKSTEMNDRILRLETDHYECTIGDFVDNTYLFNGEEITDQYSSELSTVKNIIPTKPNTKIIIEHLNVQKNITLSYYGIDGTYIGNIEENVDGHEDISDFTFDFITPSDCYGIKFTVLTTNKEKTKMYVVISVVDQVKENYENIQDLKSNYNKMVNEPIFTLVDDDGTDNIVTIKDICDTNMIKCTFAVITSENFSDQEKLDLLKTYQENGFHVTSHSATHGEFWKGTTFNEESVEKDIIQSLIALNTNHFLCSDFIVTPWGQSNMSVKRMVTKWGKALIKSTGGYNLPNECNRTEIKREFIKKTNTLEYYKELIDSCAKDCGWLVFGVHSGSSAEFDTNLVSDVIEYAKTKGRFATLNDAFNIRKPLYDRYESNNIIIE